jgi:hypothetical protein
MTAAGASDAAPMANGEVIFTLGIPS